MCRSVMIKGLEAGMVIESFTAAHHYGVEDRAASLRETFPGIDWEKQGADFFQRVIEHGRRRARKVREVSADSARSRPRKERRRHRRAPVDGPIWPMPAVRRAGSRRGAPTWLRSAKARADRILRPNQKD